MNTRIRQELRSFLIGVGPMLLIAVVLLVAMAVPPARDALREWCAKWFAHLDHSSMSCRAIMESQRRDIFGVSLLGLVFGLKATIECCRNRKIDALVFWVGAMMILVLFGVYPMVRTWLG